MTANTTRPLVGYPRLGIALGFNKFSQDVIANIVESFSAKHCLFTTNSTHSLRTPRYLPLHYGMGWFKKTEIEAQLPSIALAYHAIQADLIPRYVVPTDGRSGFRIGLECRSENLRRLTKDTSHWGGTCAETLYEGLRPLVVSRSKSACFSPIQTIDTEDEQEVIEALSILQGIIEKTGGSITANTLLFHGISNELQELGTHFPIPLVLELRERKESLCWLMSNLREQSLYKEARLKWKVKSETSSVSRVTHITSNKHKSWKRIWPAPTPTPISQYVYRCIDLAPTKDHTSKPKDFTSNEYTSPDSSLSTQTSTPVSRFAHRRIYLAPTITSKKYAFKRIIPTRSTLDK